MRKLRSGPEGMSLPESVPEGWAEPRLRWEDAVPWRAGPEPFPGACALRDLEAPGETGSTEDAGRPRTLRIIARFVTLRAVSPLHEPHATLGNLEEERTDARAYVDALPAADPDRRALVRVLEAAQPGVPTVALVAALRAAARAALVHQERYGAGGLLRAALRLERRRGRTLLAGTLAEELAALA